MRTVTELGHDILREARLPQDVHRTCLEALAGSGRLYSDNPVWSRLFLAWIDALGAPRHETLLRAAVACEYLVTGYDLVDDVYDRAHSPSLQQGLTDALPAGVALLSLAQETVARLDLPGERRARASTALARASRRVCAAQARDYALRRSPTASHDDVLAVLRHRSGALAAIPCQCAAVLAGAPWRTVALAGRFGQALGCAAQLEDDLADLGEDKQTGRKTFPTILARCYPDAPELVEATAWVLMYRFLEDAARIVRRLPASVRTEPLCTFLPPTLRAA